MSMVKRFAVYWAPEPDTRLWLDGCAWLGRDPERDRALGSRRPGTLEPWRYGFHATLKAPMQLVDTADERGLCDDIERLAARTPRFVMPMLAVRPVRGFVALVPASALGANHPLQQLADACVQELDRWRRAPSDAELERRRRAHPMDERELEHLLHWGYPYVFDRWQFHMTLTDSFRDDADGYALKERLVAEARRHFAGALAEAVICSSISVFVEPAPGKPFVLMHRVGLAV